MKLLIIEDDKALCTTLNRRLTKQNFECHEVHQAD